MGFIKYKDGFVFLKENPFILVVVTLKACGSIAWGAIDLTNVRLSENEFQIGGKGSTSLGIMFSTIGLGTGIGPFITQMLVPENLKGNLIAFFISFVERMIGYVLQGLSSSMAIFLIGNVIRSMGEGVQWVYSTTLIQRVTPYNIIGRVLAFEIALDTVVQTVSFISAGLLIDNLKISLRNVIFAFTIVAFFGSIWFLIYFYFKDTNEVSKKYKIFEHVEKENDVEQKSEDSVLKDEISNDSQNSLL